MSEDENKKNEEKPERKAGGIILVIIAAAVVIFLFARYVIPAMDQGTKPPSSILTGEAVNG